MNAIVLDAGALVALERDDRSMWTVLKLAASRSAVVLLPTAALAQVWRGGASQTRLARAMRHCDLASFDGVARAVGELCGRSRTSDICDAHVAIVAARYGRALYTSDPTDMRRLVAACGARALSIVRC